MRNTIGLIVLAVTFVVVIGFSRSRGQVDHVRVVDAETIQFVEPIVNKTISVPVVHGSAGPFLTTTAITVRGDGKLVQRPTVRTGVSPEILQLESDSRKIVKELRELPEDESEQRQDLEKRLREKLDDEFEARMRIEQDKVNELRERLKHVEDRLGKREENRQLIIDRRFAELTGDATLAWDAYSDRRLPGALRSRFQTPEGTSFTPRPARNQSSTRRFGSTLWRPDSAVERRSPARTLPRVFTSPLRRTERNPLLTGTKKNRAGVAEAEKKASDVTAVHQKAGDLLQSLRESTSNGSAAMDELDAAIDLLHELKDELKDRLDGLKSLDESTLSEDSQ